MEPESDKLGAELAKSLVRHLMQVSAGALTTAGVLTDDTSTQYITIGSAILLYLIAQGWSFMRQATKGQA